jgi:hypothetical protein
MTAHNPGPGTKYCPRHGNVWLKALEHISEKPVINASEDYVDSIHAVCGICGALLVDKIDWHEPTENID